MGREELEALDDRLIRSWDEGDADAFLGLFADEFVWYDWTSPEPIRDREAARAYFSGWTTAIPDMRTTAVERVVGDDAFATDLVWVGTNTGPMVMGGMELPATG